jgi:hypothetical protein
MIALSCSLKIAILRRLKESCLAGCLFPRLNELVVCQVIAVHKLPTLILSGQRYCFELGGGEDQLSLSGIITLQTWLSVGVAGTTMT